MTEATALVKMWDVDDMSFAEINGEKFVAVADMAAFIDDMKHDLESVKESLRIMKEA